MATPPSPPTLNLLEEQRQAAALLLERLAAARSDFRSFILYVWANSSNFQLADFHNEAIKVYADPSIRFSYWEAARGHAKSMVSTAFAVWSLGRDPNHRIKLICANDKEARKRLFEIKQQMEKNGMLKLCFPKMVKDHTGEWNKSRIVLNREIFSKDPSIEAMGVMSGALGSRSTIILLDDVVDLRNAILQPQLREHVIQKVFGEIVPLLEPNGVMRAVGTPWSLVDCNAVMKERFTLIGPHAVGTETDHFAPLWPYMFDRAALQKLHDDILGPAEFARAYRCQALTGDTVPIQAKWIKFYDAALLGDPHRMYCLQPYDLAIGDDAESDYFAYSCLLYDEKRNYIFVPDAWHDRISFRAQADAVTSNYKFWQAQLAVIENGQYQGALSSYLQESQVAMNIHNFRNRGRSKSRRVTEVQPWFEQERVFFHPKFDVRKYPEIRHRSPIVPEIVSFPFYKHDDLIDTMSMGILTIVEELGGGLEQHPPGFSDGDGLSTKITLI